MREGIAANGQRYEKCRQTRRNYAMKNERNNKIFRGLYGFKQNIQR